METSQPSSQATYTTSSNLTDIFVWTAHNWNWENVCELDRCYQSRQTGKMGPSHAASKSPTNFNAHLLVDWFRSTSIKWQKVTCTVELVSGGPVHDSQNVDRLDMGQPPTWDSLVQTGFTVLLFPSMTLCSMYIYVLCLSPIFFPIS